MTPDIHHLTATLDAAERIAPGAREHLVIDTAMCHGTVAARARCARSGTEPLTVIEALGATGKGTTPGAASAAWLTAARAEVIRLRAIARAMATLECPHAAVTAQRDACETLLTRSARFDHVMIARHRLMALPPRPAEDCTHAAA